MIRFAATLQRRVREPAALDRYLVAAGADRAVAEALLAGKRPRRVVGLDAMLHWAAEVAGVPEWLIDASLAASGDRAEVAALLLPPPVGVPPTLAEVVDGLNCCTRITAHASLVALWARLPPEANLVLNRLASGTFRARVAEAPSVTVGLRRSVLAVLVQAQVARPEVTLALWQGDVAVPVVRVMLKLAETAEIMAWIRTNAGHRFGPVRQVEPVQVFRLGFDGLVPNPRRKCGFDLVGAEVEAWVPGAFADQVGRLAEIFGEQEGD